MVNIIYFFLILENLVKENKRNNYAFFINKISHLHFFFLLF